MKDWTEGKLLQEHYGSTEKLAGRISLHEKYSVNPQGFGPWILEHYRFPQDARALELGCGTGSIWKGQLALIGRCRELILTDLSPAMVAAARDTLGEAPPLRYAVADIQTLPYADASFDAVIANMMLYHVPDLKKALGEVCRVLRAGGRFYAATYGEHGLLERLCTILAPLGIRDESARSFTLQNGEGLLGSFFSQVERFDYPDSLRVTEIEDLIDYLASLPFVQRNGLPPREEIRRLLRAQMRGGVLELPKEYGLFAAVKTE